MTHQITDPRIAELLATAAELGEALLLDPAAIIAYEEQGLTVDLRTGRLVLPVGRWLTARGRAMALAMSTLALLLLLLPAAPVQAQTRPPQRSPVPVCRLVHGHRVCLPVTRAQPRQPARAGGSGITPPIFAQGR